MSHLEPSTDTQEHVPGSVSPSLHEIPVPDPELDLSSILSIGKSESDPDVQKVQKRASNVMKLAQENEKLKAELKAMTDRLEAAERKRVELAQLEEERTHASGTST